MNINAPLRAPRRTTAARLAVALLIATSLAPALAQSLPDPPDAMARDDAMQAEVVPQRSVEDAAAPPAPADGLAAGDYRWMPELSPTGPVVIVVSLPGQRMHVYRGGVRIGVASISSGREDKPTPTGIFPILQKETEHRSNLYDDAPMPYMQRLTWDGIALHEGRVPGYPASHGCIRVPSGFASALFDVTERGTLVVVADALSNSPDVLSPGDAVPVDAYTGLEPGQAPPQPASPEPMLSDPALPATMPAAVDAVATK